MMSTANLVLSVTKSFFSHTNGNDVAVFNTESCDIVSDIEKLGFAREYYKEQSSGRMLPSNNFWNKDKEVMIFLNQSYKSFSIGNEFDCVLGSDFEQPRF